MKIACIEYIWETISAATIILQHVLELNSFCGVAKAPFYFLETNCTVIVRMLSCFLKFLGECCSHGQHRNPDMFLERTEEANLDSDVLDVALSRAKTPIC